MYISPLALKKIDPRLRDALTASAGVEGLRVLMTLRAREVLQGSAPLPEQYPSREGYRAAMIERRKRYIEEVIGETVRALAALGLRVIESPVLRTVVVDGPAEQIAKALDVPGAEWAVLDQPLELIRAVAMPPSGF